MSQEEKKDKVGLPPGTIIHTGEERHEDVIIKIIEFSEGEIREYDAYSIDGEGANTDPYPIVDSAGTIPTTTTGNEVPIELFAVAAIGVVLVLLVVVGFLKRRS